MGEEKHRHGCLTAWLALIIILNALVAGVYLFWMITRADTQMPGWGLPVYILGSICYVVCAIALFYWKKWGFYGIAAMALIIIVVNLVIGLSFVQALTGLLGIIVLYGVLQIGGEKKGWSQLE